MKSLIIPEVNPEKVGLVRLTDSKSPTRPDASCTSGIMLEFSMDFGTPFSISHAIRTGSKWFQRRENGNSWAKYITRGSMVQCD